MEKRPFHTSDKESSSKDLDDGSPRLFLKKAPQGGPTSHDDFDEMVPEFMHRDFYRSREDEFPAIDPNFQRRSQEVQKAVPLTPLRGKPQEDVKPAASAPVEPLAPLRSSPKEPESETVSLEAEERAASPAPAEQATFPRPVKTSNLNLPLVACLFFIVGLFLWREQTRPEIKETVELPVPKVVRVSEQTFEAAALEGESPYPDMAPVQAPTKPDSLPLESEDPPSSPNEVEPAEPQVSQEQPEELTSEEGPTTTYPAADASAQRAAILQRMNEGNISRNERERRLEDSGANTEPAADTSLFPEETSSEADPPAEAESPVGTPADASAAMTPDDSLFPTESEPVESVPPSVPPAPPAEPTDTQGEPYQIAEPDL